MGRTWEGTEARAVARMVCYAHPDHSACRVPGPFGLPRTTPIRATAHLGNLASLAPGPFGSPHTRPIHLTWLAAAHLVYRAPSLFGPPHTWPIQSAAHLAHLSAAHQSHLAHHIPGPFSMPCIKPIQPAAHLAHSAHCPPLSTLKGRNSRPSLSHVIGPLRPNGIVSVVKGT